MVVVLPAPFGPRNPKNSPCATVKETPSTAGSPLYDFLRSLISKAYPMLEYLNNFEMMIGNHVIVIKEKLPFKFLPGEKKRKPMFIVRPHALKRYFVYGKPLGLHF